MTRPKQVDGVIATIERLTGQVPCPEHLRAALNKYLKVPQLFPNAKSSNGKVDGKLQKPDTDVFVRNILLLDQTFGGDTKRVIKTLCNQNESKEFRNYLDSLQLDIERRRDIYCYSADHFQSLKLLLLGQQCDFRSVLINPEKTMNVDLNHQVKGGTGYALRAVQLLEKSEECGRFLEPTISDLIARADAYLALGDFVNAERNAAKVIECDQTNSQAWFIRVIVALKLRNKAISSMNRFDFESREMADTMSSHERQSRELADLASNEAFLHLRNLRKILPRALLYWPKNRWKKYDHIDQFKFVVKTFISQLFSIACNELPSSSFTQMYSPGRAYYGKGNISVVLEEIEIEALNVIFKERDSQGDFFFVIGSPESLRLDLQLLHLRSFLDAEGYSKHWREFRRCFEELPAEWTEKAIFSNENNSLVWQEHYGKNEGEESVVEALAELDKKLIEARVFKSFQTNIKQFGIQFDRLFRAGDFEACLRLSQQAQAKIVDPDIKGRYCAQLIYPVGGNISIPVHQLMYWDYLEVMSIMRLVVAGKAITLDDMTLLLRAEELSVKFQNQTECFWTESEEYEEGGGEDLYVPPFDLDLRDTLPWIVVIIAILKSSLDMELRRQFNEVLERLKVLERPFLNEDFEFFHIPIQSNEIRTTAD